MIEQSTLPSGIEATPEREQIANSVKKICDRYDDDFWSKKDQNKTFPFEFHAAMAESGSPSPAPPYSVGIVMPSQPDSAIAA